MLEMRLDARRHNLNDRVRFSIHERDTLHLIGPAGQRVTVQVMTVEADALAGEEVGFSTRTEVAILDDGRWLLFRERDDSCRVMIFESRSELGQWLWENPHNEDGTDVLVLFQLELLQFNPSPGLGEA